MPSHIHYDDEYCNRYCMSFKNTLQYNMHIFHKNWCYVNLLIDELVHVMDINFPEVKKQKNFSLMP